MESCLELTDFQKSTKSLSLSLFLSLSLSLGNPLRIIISSLNSPLYHLAWFLHNIIKKSILEAPSAVKNSYHLVGKLNGIFLNANYKLAPLDVVSLFTNVPHKRVFESIEKRWDSISVNTKIPKEEFLIAIKLILNSTFFSFKKIIYKQILGTPMDFPLSPIISDLVLQDLEQSALTQLPIRLPFYFRYVDDILLAAPNDWFDTILEIFNSSHERLQFTLEISNNDRISFLDVMIIIDGHRLVFDCYRKPTFSGRFVNFHSQHPLPQKRGIVYGLVDRALLLSHPKFQEKNLKSAIEVLLDNCFPLPFIFSAINKRIKQLSYKENNSNKEDKNVKKPDKIEFFTIPYVNSVSENFLPFCGRFEFCASLFQFTIRLRNT